MAVGTVFSYIDIDHLYLDPMNPRLGRHRMSRETTQDELLNIMREWVLDELALSYLESGGFWPYEPLIVVAEPLYGEEHFIVIEGNRRLAALKALKLTSVGEPFSKKWASMLEDLSVPESLFERVPYVRADSRTDVQEFLGFRHMTGIKQWDAYDKAGFIAHLIDKQGMSYQQAARKVGSKIPTVRRNYIAYRVLLQAEEISEDFDTERTAKQFALLYKTLDTIGAQQYLQIDIFGEPSAVKRPVSRDRLGHLAHFCRWLFGTSQITDIVTDTRQVADFGGILESADAVRYLETTRQPKFEFAVRIAGSDEEETLRHVNEAADSVELALMQAQAFKDSPNLRKALTRLGANYIRLMNPFSEIKKQLFEEGN